MISATTCEPWSAIFPCDLSATAPSITGSALQIATDVLWALSGRQFGSCTITFRPCRFECLDWSPLLRTTIYGVEYAYPSPALIDGLWYNLGCGGTCAGSCSCNTESQFVLPQPTSSIINITIDGAVVPTGSYRIDNFRYVVRTDGVAWPRCNDGTWTVTAVFGTTLPESGRLAVGVLACEIVKLLSDKQCQLPARVQQLSRQGVSVTLLDPQDFLEEGRTGLYLPDLFIKSFNPSGLTSRSRMYGPDRPMTRFQTSP